MRRYWLPPESFQSGSVEITADSFHHIIGVCRQELGSQFEILGDGRNAHLVEVSELGKKSATAKIISSRILPELPKPKLVLALSFSRYPTLDAVVEKAVEMGVTRIEPFYSEFSFIRSGKSLSDSKVERWSKIVKSATQQCGRADLMEITPPTPLAQTLDKFSQTSSAKGLFAYEGASNLGLKSELEKNSSHFKNLEEYWVFVGSEGGFSTTEVEVFKARELQPVTLGDQVLRVETACIALLAVLKYELGQMTLTETR
jgi:16S rRNA (uracil1498-N3)-methyltransferase